MNREFKIRIFSALFLLFNVNSAIAADEALDIVGSSTVYPFSKLVVDQLAVSNSALDTKIESTGSGGGIHLFCGGGRGKFPDIANSSRRIKRSEYEMCLKNDVNRIVEIKIGYDGIIMATSKQAVPLQLTRKDIFLALAAKVPAADHSDSVVPNPYKTWKEVNPSLPALAIKVLGPPPTSGTRDALEEMALEEGCQTFEWIGALKKKNKRQYQEICHTIRQDGVYVDSGEDDKLIVQQLSEHAGVVGIFGFSFLDQNSHILTGALLEGIQPSFENISSGVYPLSRPLFFYVNAAHVGISSGINEYLNEITSDRAWGPEGYLAANGLIPMSEQERQRYRKAAEELSIFEMQ